ncbi:hypothetical protein TNCV_1857671 [Trichonephila clavipes]|nr:hypothetical protein TNCV_1857671 [Trichonephila clavipes]
MNIILKDDIPVCQRARRLSCSEKLQVNDQIDDWLQQGIIREKCSDYCSPIVLYSPLVSMKKKRNKYRCGQRTVRLAVVESSATGISSKARSLRAQAQLIKTETKTWTFEKRAEKD